MSKIVRAATVFDALGGQVTLLVGLQGFSFQPFAAQIQYHRVSADDPDPAIDAIIGAIDQPEQTALLIDAGGRDDVHVLSEHHFSLALERKVAGIAVNGAVRGDTHQRLTGVLSLFAMGRCLAPWAPAEEEMTLTYYEEAATDGSWLIGDADGVLAITAEQALEVGLVEPPHQRIA